MLATGAAHAFAPAGRRFREWAAITPAQELSWGELLREAFDFVSRAKA